MNLLKSPKFLVLLGLCLVALFPMIAAAGTTAPGLEGIGADKIFDDSKMLGGILGLVLGLATGTLGKVVSVLTLIVTLIMGLPRGNIMGVLFGFAMAAAFWFGPGMLIQMFSATF